LEAALKTKGFAELFRAELTTDNPSYTEDSRHEKVISYR